jgi:hypothetical protein
MKRIVSILIAAVCMTSGALAKSKVEVETPQRIVLGQAFDVVYWADGTGQGVTLKANDAFKIVSGPYRYAENYTVREKGRLMIRTRTAYSYRMIPLVSGDVKLPKAKIKLSKGNASSKAEKIDVQEPRTMSQLGFADPFDLFFDQPMPPMPPMPGFPGEQSCHGKKHGKQPCKQHGDRPCPHHQIKVDTFRMDEVDTTGCALVICAPDSAVEGEEIGIRYTISAKADSITLSESADWEIVSGPFYGTESYMSIINGQKQPNRYQKQFTYIVRARKAGELALPQAEVWIGDTRKSSEQKTISIQPKPAK